MSKGRNVLLDIPSAQGRLDLLPKLAGAERRAGRMKLSRSLAAAVICKLLAAFFGWSCKTYLLASARKPS
jgi:hypothetical protein